MKRNPFKNIAAYKFVKLPADTLGPLADNLRATCKDNHLYGTVLLSEEGINLCVAGQETAIKSFWNILTDYDAFSDMSYKASFSKTRPFRRLKVRIREQLIPMRGQVIDPTEIETARLSPRELKAWLDEGRDIMLLDTRNRYEMSLGTFTGARGLNIDTFDEFPDAIQRLGHKAGEQPIVMFCTGGIRCEKAAPLMLQHGFTEVYQLDGGILKYFEDCGDSHYDGECFVYDDRIALDSNLKPTGTVICPGCQRLVTRAEQQHEGYVPGKSCPSCAANSEHD